MLSNLHRNPRSEQGVNASLSELYINQDRLLGMMPVGVILDWVGAEGTQPPVGWAVCNGQVVPTHSNPQLTRLLGKRYGGDGTTHIALPDLTDKVTRGAGDRTQGWNVGGTVAYTTGAGAQEEDRFFVTKIIRLG